MLDHYNLHIFENLSGRGQKVEEEISVDLLLRVN